MIYIIIGLSLLIISTIFVIYNLLQKVEILLKEEYLDKLKVMVDDSYKRIKDLDTVQAFESDDEVGHFFTNLKDIIVTLNTYLQNYTKK